MPVAAAAAIAVAGGIAGAQKDKASTSSISNSESRVEAAPASAEELKARSISLNAVQGLDERIKQLESSPVLQNLEKLLNELGQDPSQQRIDAANQFASQVFAPRQTALNQSFQDQTQAYAQRAAQMGRSTSDPILAAKLAQEQIRQQAALNAEQGSFAAQEALSAPARQFQNQFGGFQGLTQNAIANRQAVFSLGSDFANTQMQYRLATATRYGTQVGNGYQESGGGFKGFMTGFTGAGAAGAKMFAGGGGGS